MLKRTIVRLLLFGIPFGLSYWATRPVAPVDANKTLVLCAYPGDRPGELRINLAPAGCPASDGGSTITGVAPGFPAMNVPRTMDHSAKRTSIPF